LVKTAFAGEDANWGRIVMAVGRKADEPIDRARIKVQFGPLVAAQDGHDRRPPMTRAEMSAYMKNAELEVSVDVGVGKGAARRSCDACDLDQAVRGDQRGLPLIDLADARLPQTPWAPPIIIRRSFSMPWRTGFVPWRRLVALLLWRLTDGSAVASLRCARVCWIT
jgi:hypothetical protein